MYEWKFINDEARDAAGDLPTAAAVALMEFMAAMSLDPWGVAGIDRDAPNMPNLVFGPGAAGLVSCLILEDQRQIWVTKVQWAG